MDGARRIIKNIFQLSISRVYLRAVNLISVILVSNYLGPESFGILVLALSYLAIINNLSLFGIEKYFIKRTLKDKSFFKSTFLPHLILSIAIFIFFGIYTIFTNSSDEEKFITLIVCSSILLIPYRQLEFLLQSDERFSFIALTSVTITTLLLLLKLCIIYFDLGIILFAWTYLVDSAFYFLIYLFAIREQKAPLYLSFSPLFKLIKESSPLFFYSFVAIIFLKFDHLFISNYLGNTNLSIYGISAKFTEVWFILPVLVSRVLFNRSAQNKVNELKFSTLMSIASSLIVIVFVHYFGENFLNILFKDDYSNTIAILKIYIWVLLFESINIASINYFVSLNKTNYLLYKSTLTLLLNICLCFFLYENYGLQGIAWAKVISYICYTTIFNLLFRETRMMLYYQFNLLKFSK